MSSSTLRAETTSVSSNGTATALAIGSVLAALGSVVYMSMNGLPPREAYLHPVNSVGGIGATIGVVVLALTLVRWRTTTLPAWAILCAAAGLVMIAPEAWFDAIGVRAVAGQVDNAEFERLFFQQPWMFAMLVPKAVLGLVGFVALGLAGWRQRSLPRSSSVLLVLAGVASVWPPYPPGLLLASAALFIASRSVRKAPMGSEENQSVVERFDALINTQELDLLEELCTPDMVNHTLAPNRPPGLDGTREFLRNAGRGQWKADRWRSVRVVSDGDFVVQFGVRNGRWPGGTFRGIDVPAGDYARDFAAMYRLIDGRIAERWAVRDDLGMMLQLGALNPDTPREDESGPRQYLNSQNF